MAISADAHRKSAMYWIVAIHNVICNSSQLHFPMANAYFPYLHDPVLSTPFIIIGLQTDRDGRWREGEWVYCVTLGALASLHCCCLTGGDSVIANWINWSSWSDGATVSRWPAVPVYPAPQSRRFKLTLKIKSFFPYRSSFSWAWIFLDCKGKIRK